MGKKKTGIDWKKFKPGNILVSEDGLLVLVTVVEKENKLALLWTGELEFEVTRLVPPGTPDSIYFTLVGQL